MAAILRSMLLLILLIAVAGGGAAYWMYSRSDEQLRQIVLKQLNTAAPDLRFEIARTNFGVLGGKVWIYGMSIYFPEDERDRPSIEIPETIATLDSGTLSDFESVVIQKLYLVKPKLRLLRRSNNTWNIPNLALTPSSGTPIPDLEIANASILIDYQLDNQSIRKFPFKNFNVSVHPADSRRVSIRVGTLFEPPGRAKLEPFGPITLDIEAALDGSKWECSSSDPWKIPIDEGVIQLASDLIPDLEEKFKRFQQTMEAAKHSASAASAKPFAPRATHPRLTELGLNCQSKLIFEVKKDAPEKPVLYRANVDFVNGHIVNEALPFPLGDVAGSIYVDNRQISARDFRASSGPAKFFFTGDVIPSTPIKAEMKVRGIELTDELKSRMPEKLRRVIDSLDLSGIFNGDISIVQDAGKWPMSADLVMTKGTVTHERFPVTVRDVEGELHLHDGVVEFDARGRYAGQVVRANGTIQNPGPEQSADIYVAGDNLPLDKEAIAACPPAVRSSIEALRLTGQTEARLRVTRQAGPNHKYEPDLNLHVTTGSLNLKQFPYAINELNGYVRWRGDVVEFNEVKGAHDGAKIQGVGKFDRTVGQRGRLDLEIVGNDAEFDRSLAMALPKSLQKVWDQFQPKGNFDVRSNVQWSPGSPCVIALPSVVVRDGEVTMRCFPWPITSLAGEFEYNTNANEPGKLLIKSVKAQHDDSLLSVNGTGWFAAGQRWRLEFDRMIVENLKPNTTFRNALPAGMRKIVDTLRPEGTFTLEGPVLFYELPATSQTVGAAWKLNCILSRCAMTAGTRIEDIHGAVKLDGTWDGNDATLDGDLDISSLRVFRSSLSGRSYQLTKVLGPFSFRNGQLIAGNERAIPPRESNTPDPLKRIRGTAIQGTMFLDAAVSFGEEPVYRMFVELQNGRLEEYARQYLRGQSNLRGVLNGWMNLGGSGSDLNRMTGNGKLLIAPAALYELPMFVQIFNVVRLQSIDKTAFDQAQFIFNVANQRFNFSSIEMQGESIKLGGTGFVRFDGAMQLQLGVSQKQLIPNPVTGGVLPVSVTGSVGTPHVEVGTRIDLDEGVRQFLAPLGRIPTRPMYPTPRSTQVNTQSSR